MAKSTDSQKAQTAKSTDGQKAQTVKSTDSQKRRRPKSQATKIAGGQKRKQPKVQTAKKRRWLKAQTVKKRRRKRKSRRMMSIHNVTENKRNTKAMSILLVLTAGSLWGFMGLLVRSLNGEGLSSMEICFVRAAVTFVCMLIGLLILDRKALRIRLKDLWCFIGTGAFSVTFFNYCYFKTIVLTSLSVAAVLLYTAPAFVMLMSAVLFGEKLSVQKLGALVLAFLGCAFVSGMIGGDHILNLSGILCGLGAGFGYALYSIFGRYALERGYSSVTISFYTFFFAMIAALFFVDAGKIAEVITGSGQLLIKTVFLVLLVTLLPYLSYTKGLNGMENGAASVLASIEPVIATLVGVFIYKEALDVWNVIGILLVLASIVLINSGTKKA